MHPKLDPPKYPCKTRAWGEHVGFFSQYAASQGGTEAPAPRQAPSGRGDPPLQPDTRAATSAPTRHPHRHPKPTPSRAPAIPAPPHCTMALQPQPGRTRGHTQCQSIGKGRIGGGAKPQPLRTRAPLIAQPLFLATPQPPLPWRRPTLVLGTISPNGGIFE